VSALVIRDVRLFDGTSDRPVERASVTVADGRIASVVMLRAATAAAADTLRRPDLGRIAPGAAADLVLVRGNPLRRLADSRAIAAVVARGRLYDP
jgi:cytosine/adenosine deaminase-related metal-dependent hydrolase